MKGVLSYLLVLCCPGPVWAAPLLLDWQAGDCASMSEVMARTEALLHRPLKPFGPFTLRAAVVFDTDRRQLSIQTTDKNGRKGFRSMPVVDCREAVEVTALVLSLAFEESDSPKAHTVTPTSVVRQMPENRLGLGAYSAGMWGVLPDASLGYGLYGVSSFAGYRLEAFLSRSQESIIQGIPREDAGLALQLEGALGLRGCYPLGHGRWQWAGCGGLHLGALRGTGMGVAKARSGIGLWANVEAAGLIQFEVGRRFSLWADVTFGTSLSRPQFVTEGVGAMYQVPLLNARAGIGLTFWLSP